MRKQALARQALPKPGCGSFKKRGMVRPRDVQHSSATLGSEGPHGVGPSTYNRLIRPILNRNPGIAVGREQLSSAV